MKFRKIFFTVILTSVLVSGVSAVSTIDKAKVSEGMNDFAWKLLFAVPEAATQQNVWSDAYIGNLYPSIFPHFGVGFTLGGTYLDTSGLKKAVGELSGNKNFLMDAVGNNEIATKIMEGLGIGDFPEGFVLPTATLDIRLGGLVLPFDVGICAMMTNPAIFDIKLSEPSTIIGMNQAMTFDLQGFKGFIDYVTLGADLRYRFFEGSTFVPVISIGGGYYYTQGNFKIGTTDSREITIAGKTGNQVTDMNIGIGFQTHVAFAQIQISKEIGFANLFLGARGVISNTTTSWAWDYKTKNENPELSAASNEAHDDGCVTANGIDESFHDGIWDMTKIQPQIFAGVGFNAWKFQFTLGACADVRSFFDPQYNIMWSGYFSTHFKL